MYTPNVATRWYKAPEILLNFRDYNTPIDIWALGCIIGEMYLLRPLFPGENEIDEFFQICSLLGPPTEKTWYKGFQAATNLNLILPQVCIF